MCLAFLTKVLILNLNALYQKKKKKVYTTTDATKQKKNGPALSSHAERTGARSSFFQDGGLTEWLVFRSNNIVPFDFN